MRVVPMNAPPWNWLGIDHAVRRMTARFMYQPFLPTISLALPRLTVRAVNPDEWPG